MPFLYHINSLNLYSHQFKKRTPLKKAASAYSKVSQDTDADAILNAIPSLNYRIDSLPAPQKTQ